MNKKDSFIDKLHRELKDFPPEKQKEILDEISSHLEENNMEKHHKTPLQNGTPEEMAANFKEVHRPKRFLDLLMVILPVFILFPLLQVLLPYFKPLTGELNPFHYLLNIRIIILISGLLFAVARKRKSLFLSGFWLVSTLNSCLVLIFREERWKLIPASSVTVTLENLFWLAVLLFLLFWLIKEIRNNKNNLMFLIFILLPFSILLANLTQNYSVQQNNVILSGVQNTVQNIGNQQNNALPFGIQNILDIYLFKKMIELIAYVLVFLGQKKYLRWAGLLLIGTSSTYTLLQAYGIHVLAYLPTFFVCLAWLLDILKKPIIGLKNKSA